MIESEGISGETDWCIMDEEMNFTEFLSNADTIIYGMESHDLWGKYIPGNKASDMEEPAL